MAKEVLVTCDQIDLIGGLENILKKYIGPGISANRADSRMRLTEEIDQFFAICDAAKVSRPVDFNIGIANNGDIKVFFAKDWT